jgi:hypothetical protein
MLRQARVIGAVAAAVFAILLLPACGGGRAIVQASGQTCGQELSDLQAARERNAISQREYDRLRKATLDRCSRRR